MPPVRQITHPATGETRGLCEWARLRGLSPPTLFRRLDLLGWDVARALDTPPDPRRRHGGRPRADAPRQPPRLSHHKPTGQARVRWRAGGAEHVRYLGRWGSADARDAYRRFVAEWATGPAEPTRGGPSLTVAALLIQWLKWCETEYVKHGRETSEQSLCRAAAKSILDAGYGPIPATAFGPIEYRAVRAGMIEAGRPRVTITKYCARIARAFRWAVGSALIPAGVAAALRDVPHLKPGRSDAPELPPVGPPDPAAVAAALEKIPGRPGRVAAIRAAVLIQRLTGMRPGEVCALRPADLDRAGDVWVYTVGEANKNLHRGKAQRYHLGPKAQAALAPFLAGEPARPALGFSRPAYWAAIHTGCRRAGVAPWHPHQLRHELATAVAARYESLERAADAIGDTPAAARGYVHVDPREAAKREIAREMG